MDLLHVTDGGVAYRWPYFYSARSIRLMASVVGGGPPNPRLLFTNAAVAHGGVRCDRCCLLVSKALKIQVFLSL